MNSIGIVAAGLVATAVMTMMMYAAPMMGMPKMDIVGMLGSMFTSSKGGAMALGLTLHFMMGVLFAFAYVALWSFGIGSATWLWGLAFGAAHGVLALVAMPVMMGMHPRRPPMDSGPMMMAGMLMGHMVYGLVVALVYSAV